MFRTLVLLGLLVVGMFVYFLRYLKATENVQDMKRYVAQTYPITGSMNCDAFDDATSMDLGMLYGKMVKREKSKRERWWSLNFPDMNIVRWSWEQVAGPKSEQPDPHQNP